MSRRYRLSNAAARGLLILALSGFGIPSAAQSPSPPSGAPVAQEATQDQQRPQAGQSDTTPFFVKVVPEEQPKSGDPENPCEKPPDREWSDLCQQWRMANAAKEQVEYLRRQTVAAEAQAGFAADQNKLVADQNRLLAEQNRLVSFQNSVLIGEAILLFLAFGASAGAVWFTAKQTRELKREFEATHRPKIRIKHVWLVGDIWDGTTVKIDLVITNVGLSDATFNVGTLRSVIQPYGHHLPQEPDLKKPDPYVIKNPVIGPGMTHYLPRYELHDGLSATQIDEIKRQVSQFYVIGTVQYLDAEKRVRNTAFCRVLKYSPQEGAHLFTHDDANYEYQD